MTVPSVLDFPPCVCGHRRYEHGEGTVTDIGAVVYPCARCRCRTYQAGTT